MLQRVSDVGEAEQSQQNEHIEVLKYMMLGNRRFRIESQNRIPDDVRVVVDIVGVHVVLHDMLVDPVHSTAADPVLTDT